MRSTGTHFGMATVAAVAVGASAVKMAGDFESSTTRLVTSAGESDAAIGEVRRGMLDMAGQVGFSAEKLAAGMYVVESAGYHAGDALSVLKAAAQGAKEENAQLATVADAVSTVLTDYHLKGDQAARVTSQLVTAVGQGKTTMEEFSGSLHSVVPIAAEAGIKLEDVTGTLATMTMHGMSAEQASQNLADTIRKLIKPTSQQRDELAQLHMTATDLSDGLSTRGLQGTLEHLSETILGRMGESGKMLLDAFRSSKDAANNMTVAIQHMSPPMAELATRFKDGHISLGDYVKGLKAMPADQAMLGKSFASIQQQAEGFTNALKNGSPQAQNYMQALQAVTGDATALNTTLMVTHNNSDAAQNNIRLIGEASTEAGGNVKGWHEIQANFNQKLQEATAALGALWITIGQELLPVITPLVKGVADLAHWFGEHPALAKAVAIGILAIAAALGVATIAMWAMSTTPVFWIIAAIVVAVVAVIAAIVLMAMHWREIWDAIKLTASAIAGWVKSYIWDPLVIAFHAVGEALSWLKTNVWDPVWDALTETVKFAWNNILRPIIELALIPIFFFVGSAIYAFKGTWDAAWAAITDVARWAWDNVLHPVFSFINDHAIQPTAGFIRWLGDIFGGVMHWIGDVSRDAWDNRIRPVFSWINDYGIKPMAGFINWLGDVWNSVWGGIVGTIRWAYGIIQSISGWIGDRFSEIMSAFRTVGSVIDKVAGAVGIHLPSLDVGGWVPGQPGEPVLAVIHGGEYVLSRDMIAGRVTPDESIAKEVGDLGKQTPRAASSAPPSVGLIGVPQQGQGGNVFITVMGTVTAERDLVAQVRQSTLRYNMQNSGNGLSLAGH
jgi:TP901 family phage tail tape measure protein